MERGKGEREWRRGKCVTEMKTCSQRRSYGSEVSPTASSPDSDGLLWKKSSYDLRDGWGRRRGGVPVGEAFAFT